MTIVRPQNVFDELFTDGTSTDMVVDGSVTGGIAFAVTAPTGQYVVLKRLLVDITDSAIEPPKFGGIGALSNGLSITVHKADATELYDFTAGHPVKANTDWTLLAGVDGVRTDALGAGVEGFAVRWSFHKAADIILYPGEYVQVLVQDAMTGLASFRMAAQGYWVANPATLNVTGLA